MGIGANMNKEFWILGFIFSAIVLLGGCNKEEPLTVEENFLCRMEHNGVSEKDQKVYLYLAEMEADRQDVPLKTIVELTGLPEYESECGG